jgi:hypothetical protein
VLSEREERALLEAEAYLLRHDERFVRSFDDLGRCDPPPPAHDVIAEPVRAPAVARARLSAQDQLLRAFFLLGIAVMLAVCVWVFREGDTELRLLTGLVMFPVLGLLGFTVVVLSLRHDG